MNPVLNPHATLENCRYCLMCRHADPLSHVTFNEALTPHGIALTVASQRRGLLEWNEETLSILYSEADAGIARAHCATDQPFSEAVAQVRAEVAAGGSAPPRVYDLRNRLEQYGSLWGDGNSEAPDGQGDVALFVGDEGHYLRPGLAAAACTLLRTLGLDAIAVGQGRNSGFMAASLGFPDLARGQARALLDDLEQVGANRLIVLGPGDAYSLTRLYPERLGVLWPESVEVVELTVLLAEALATDDLKLEPLHLDAPYAYVDPTHAVRRPERVDAPRVLLEALVKGVRRELFWRRERAHPVGSTALQFTHPELADKLTRSRLEDARSRGVRHLVCDDPATLFQLERFAPGYGLELHGLYELVNQHLG